MLDQRFQKMPGVGVSGNERRGLCMEGLSARKLSSRMIAKPQHLAGHIAILTAVGHSQVNVKQRVSASILSSGNELTEASREASPRTIFDSNRPMLMALLAYPKVKLHDAGL